MNRLQSPFILKLTDFKDFPEPKGKLASFFSFLEPLFKPGRYLENSTKPHPWILAEKHLSKENGNGGEIAWVLIELHVYSSHLYRAYTRFVKGGSIR